MLSGAAVLGGVVSGVLLPLLIVVAFAKFSADGTRWMLTAAFATAAMCVTYTIAAVIAIFSLAAGDWVSCLCDAGCAARLAGGGVALPPAQVAFICEHAPLSRAVFYLGLIFALAAAAVEVAIMREVALQSLDELPTVVLPLQHAPLFVSRRIGPFAFRSQLVATGVGAPAAAAAAAFFACEEGGTEPGKAADWGGCGAPPAAAAAPEAARARSAG